MAGTSSHAPKSCKIRCLVRARTKVQVQFPVWACMGGNWSTCFSHTGISPSPSPFLGEDDNNNDDNNNNNNNNFNDKIMLMKTPKSINPSVIFLLKTKIDNCPHFLNAYCMPKTVSSALQKYSFCFL